MPETDNSELVDPALAIKLDALTVPDLPPGFADRLVAAALAEAATASALPPLRRPRAQRWLRGGVAGLGALTVGMISISAAAMGYLGEPIRNAVSEAPVIGKVIERVIPKAARQPKKAAAPRLAKPAPPKVDAAPGPALIEEAQSARRLTPMERRERRREIMADPEKRRAWIEAHPVAAERLMRRAEQRRRRIEAGLPPVPGPGARIGSQVPVQAMPGPMRRERLERLRERRRRRLEMRRLNPDRIDEPPSGEAQP